MLDNVNKLLKTKSLLTSPIASSKLSRQKFKFPLKVMGSNLGYLLKSFLLYLIFTKQKNVLKNFNKKLKKNSYFQIDSVFQKFLNILFSNSI